MGSRKQGFNSKKTSQRESKTIKHTRSLKNKARDVQRLLKKVRQTWRTKYSRMHVLHSSRVSTDWTDFSCLPNLMVPVYWLHFSLTIIFSTVLLVIQSVKSLKFYTDSQNKPIIVTYCQTKFCFSTTGNPQNRPFQGEGQLNFRISGHFVVSSNATTAVPRWPNKIQWLITRSRSHWL